MNPGDADPQSTFDLTYLDQSSNRYRFWRTEEDQPARFIYDPVQPEHSSSGTYSGGTPQEGELSEQQVADLLRRVRTLEAATKSHTEKRQMGTGSFRIREGQDEERRFILRSGAQRREFEEFLEPFRG